MIFHEDGHIATSVRLMEKLKNDLLINVARFHRTLYSGAMKKAANTLGQIMVTCYLLGKRLGLTYYKLDGRLEGIIRAQLRKDENEPLRENLLELLQYLSSREE